MGISRYELPAVHPEEAEEHSSEAERPTTNTISTKPPSMAAPSMALSSPFDDEVLNKTDAGWSNVPDPIRETPTQTKSAIVRLDEPGNVGPAAAADEDDFSDFDDPSVPPMPERPIGAPPPPDGREEIHLSPKAIVVSTLGPSELRKLPLDPQIMFVLTQLDGVTDLDTVLEMTGVPVDAALDALDALARKGVIVRIS